MDKDNNLEDNKKCDKLECVSEDEICGVNGGATLLKPNAVLLAYGGPGLSPRILKYGATNMFKDNMKKNISSPKNISEKNK